MPGDYDLVVVGAGSAGAVVAARVSEHPRARVLLLEAGPDYPSLDALPPDLRDGNDNSYVAHDWGFTYRPSDLAPEQPFPRGKVVGGSSAVNTCIALRGEPEDYEEWARLAGPEWTWERCLGAFVRLEADQDFGDAPYHGSSGPLPIRRYPPGELRPIQRAFLEAWAELGLPSCPDHNAPGSTGAGPTPLNKRDSLRISVATAYLDPARGRPNLTVRGGALVRRVVVQGGEVRGVELADGETVDCPLVCVSAGAVMTPPLLVRSGIGPRDALERLGVEPVAVRPGVGARLLDHPATAIVLRCGPGLVDTQGPLMQTCARHTVAERNDLFLEPLSFVPWFGRDPSLVALAAAVYRTRGAGQLGVVSADPAAQPVIDSRFFAEPADLDLLVEGVRLLYRLACTDALREVTEEIVAPLPQVIEDDRQLREHIRRFCGSGFHPCGTAPMGHPDDPGAVCDQYGRVVGVRGLWVADASLAPTVPRANTNIPTIMIGERVGAWLAQELS